MTKPLTDAQKAEPLTYEQLRWRECYVIRDCGYRTPCWVWTRCGNGNGYGAVSYKGKKRYPHRVMYELATGTLPRYLDHLCRVPMCVNPEHLEPVTNAENTQRGRKAKITVAQVHEIRRRRASGEKLADLAVRFGVTGQNISDIARRRTWANV